MLGICNWKARKVSITLSRIFQPCQDQRDVCIFLSTPSDAACGNHRLPQMRPLFKHKYRSNYRVRGMIQRSQTDLSHRVDSRSLSGWLYRLRERSRSGMPPKAAANSFRHADRSPACPANELMPLTWIRRTNGLPVQPDNVVSQCKQYAITLEK